MVHDACIVAVYVCMPWSMNVYNGLCTKYVTHLSESMATINYRKKYKEEDIQRALNLVANDGYSVRKAAAEAKVPQSTLSFRLRNGEQLQTFIKIHRLWHTNITPHIYCPVCMICQM